MNRIGRLSKFRIGLQSDGIAATRPLSELILAEPNRITYQPFANIVGKNGVGHNVEAGFPFARWEWDWLPQTDIDVLQGYEARDVYIQTSVDTGTIRQFRVFACYAQRLALGEIERRVAQDGNDGIRQRRAVTMDFYGLVDYTIQVSSFG